MSVSAAPASLSMSSLGAELDAMELPPAPTPTAARPTPVLSDIPDNDDPSPAPSPASSTRSETPPPPVTAPPPRDPIWNTLLQRSFNPPFLSPSASLVHAQGSLRKFGSKLTLSSMNARHFILSHHSLQYFKSDPFSKPQGLVNLIGAQLAVEASEVAIGMKPVPPPGCVWSVSTPMTPQAAARKYVFVSDSPVEKEVWLALLSASTNEESRAKLRPQAQSSWESDVNLCLEGWLYKSGADLKVGWNRRYFIYMRSSHTLAYFKSPPKAAGFVPIESGASVDIVASSAAAVSTPPSPPSRSGLAAHAATALAALPPGIDTQSALAYTQSKDRCYVLLASSATERDDWVAALRCAVEFPCGSTRSFERSRAPAGGPPAAVPVPAAASPKSPRSPRALPAIPPKVRGPTATSAAATSAGAAAGAGAGTGVGAKTGTGTGTKSPGTKTSTGTSPVSGPTPTPSSGSASSSSPSTAPSTPPPRLFGTPSASPALAPRLPPPVLASPKGASATPSTPSAPKRTLPPPSPSQQQQQQQQGSPLTSEVDDGDEDWSIGPGRTKGESVSYVTLASKKSPGGGRRVKPKLETALEEGDEGEEEDAGDTEEEADSNSRTNTITPPTPRVANLTLVEKSLLELYSTEATFVNGLRAICTQYLLRFRRHLELKLEPRWFEEAEHAQFTIFQYVENIRDLNMRLLRELEAIQQEDAPVVVPTPITTATTTATTAATTSPATAPTPTHATRSSLGDLPPLAPIVGSVTGSMSAGGSGSKLLSTLGRIGRTFRQFVPFFKIYTLFAQSYDEQLKALDALAEKRASLKSFLVLTDACEGTTLSALMITPVQRVGRYVLLLETILRNTPEGYEGTRDIEGALDDMRKVGRLINETVALWEAKSKVVELQAKIDLPILAPGRFLVREGVLKKLYNRSAPSTSFFATHLGKKSDSFTFILMNDALLQCKKSQMSDRYSHRATLPIDGMMIEDLPDTADVKAAWNIKYATAAASAPAASGAAATTGGGGAATTATAANPGHRTTLSGSYDFQTSPLAPLRPPSIANASPPLVPTAGDADQLLPPAALDRKTVTVFAASAEEKRRWIADLTSLIEETKQKNKTLMRG